jgi:hypothetical protein
MSSAMPAATKWEMVSSWGSALRRSASSVKYVISPPTASAASSGCPAELAATMASVQPSNRSRSSSGTPR